MDKIANYFKESIHEIKKITWPSKKETTNYTILVIGMTAGLAIFLGGLDWIFNQILQKLIIR